MKRRAYTLIEPLAILATVTILATLLLPALARSAEQSTINQSTEAQNARRLSCVSNLKQLGLATMQYAQDYDEKFPPASISPPTPDNSQAFNHAYGWADAMFPYLKSFQILQCPEDRHASGTNPDPTHATYTDYWLNRNLAGRAQASIYIPSQTLLAGDGDGGSPASNSRYAITRLPRAWPNTPNSPARRHLDAANYAFADGHVQTLKPTHILTTKAIHTQYGNGTFSTD